MCVLVKVLFIFTFLICQATSTEEVIYRLSKKDYARLPIKIHLDRFSYCLNEPDGVYCTAHADVVSDGPSELLDLMHGYSAFDTAHFNYTRLRYGMCMTQTCREYYNGTSEPELQVALEACLNDTMSRRYGLKTRVTEMSCYFEDETKNNKYPVDWLDWVAAAVLFIIFAMNVIGTVYDMYMKNQTEQGNKVLLSFSWRRNWEQLMAPPSTDPRAAELQSFNGVRFLTCLILVMGHLSYGYLIYVEDPTAIEKMYENTSSYVFLNANMATQSFFLMSGFLLVYNMQISTEKQPFTWKKYFKSIFLRYVRLSTIGLFAMMLTVTWVRFGSKGPLWQDMSGIAVDHCRKYWIYNVLLVHNYVDSVCEMQTWSSASDFHFHILGLTVILLAPSAAWRRAVLAIIYIVGFLWPVYTVVTNDLDGNVITRPELVSRYNVGDTTFNYLYKPSQNNVLAFIVGMTFGYIVYDLQKRKVTTQDHTKYRYVYWFLVPLLYDVLGSAGYFFYQEGPRAPLLLRALYTPVAKPLLGLIVMLIILGAILKVETLYRGILEWHGFVPLAKLSYCVYTLHVGLARVIVGGYVTLWHKTPTRTMVETCGMLILVLIVSFVVHMAVEAPLSKLARMAIAEQRPSVQHAKGKTVNGETAKGETANSKTANRKTTYGETANGKTANGKTASGKTKDT